MRSYFYTLTLLLGLFHMSNAVATSVLPMTLEQLSTRATLIFYAEVIDNRTQQDQQNGVIATYTDFRIIDLIKGESGEIHTIKQIGGSLKDKNIRMRVHGVPQFQIGRSYVVFLPQPSSLGYSSPLGLHQGSFSVITVNGEQVVTNGQRLNSPQSARALSANVQIPLAVQTENPARAYLDDFVNTVRNYSNQ